MFLKKIIFSKGKLNAKCIQFALFHFLYNQLPMKIVFTPSYETYFKDNTKNYVTNYYVLVFLISVIFFVAYNIGRREYIIYSMYKNQLFLVKTTGVSINKKFRSANHSLSENCQKKTILIFFSYQNTILILYGCSFGFLNFLISTITI